MFTEEARSKIRKSEVQVFCVVYWIEKNLTTYYGNEKENIQCKRTTEYSKYIKTDRTRSYHVSIEVVYKFIEKFTNFLLLFFFLNSF